MSESGLSIITSVVLYSFHHPIGATVLLVLGVILVEIESELAKHKEKS
jgi:hypothetical protein